MRRALGMSFATVLIAAVACDEFTEGKPSADAGAGEASTNVDGSTEADAGGQLDAAPAIPFCSTTDAALCWSFDDESSGTALYGTTFQPKGTPPVLSQMANSPPNAMRAAGDGASGATMITMNVPATSSITCSMRVFLEEITSETEILSFSIGSRTTAFLVEPLDMNAVKAALLADRTSAQKKALPNLPKKKWIKVTLAGQRVSNGFLLAAATEDGTFATADYSDAGLNIFALPLALEIGYFVQFGGAGAVRVDDIECQYQ